MSNVASLAFCCSSCGQKLSATPDIFGQSIACPACNYLLVVPSSVSEGAQVAVPASLPLRSPNQPNPELYPPSPPPPSLPQAAPALWNPNAAISWSLLFSSLFGMILHYRNWKQLGEAGKARTTMTWIGIKVVLLGAITLLVCNNLRVGNDLQLPPLTPVFIEIGLLLAWVLHTGWSQEALVKKQFPQFIRKKWGTPLLIALGATVAYAAVVGVLSTVVAGKIGSSTQSNVSKSQESADKATPSSVPEAPISRRNAGENPESKVPITSPEYIESATRALVSDTLESPSSAKFSDFAILKSEPPYYQTVISVDSQNQFGAMIRQYAVCTFKVETDGIYSHPAFATEKFDSMAEIKYQPGLLQLQRERCKWPKTEAEKAKEAADKIANERAAETQRLKDELAKQELKDKVKAKEKAVADWIAKSKAEEAALSKDREETIARAEAKTDAEIKRLTGGGSDGSVSGEQEAERAQNGLPAPSATAPPTQALPEESTKPSAKSVSDAKIKLAGVNSKIESERQRWTTATATINKLTNNKRTPVQEGTQAYYRCLEASNVIKEVESGAAGLKEEKASLEAIINEAQ